MTIPKYKELMVRQADDPHLQHTPGITQTYVWQATFTMCTLVQQKTHTKKKQMLQGGPKVTSHFSKLLVILPFISGWNEKISETHLFFGHVCKGDNSLR